jgi:hypothetical protein
MKSTAAGPQVNYQPGQEVDVSAEVGKAFVEGGYADPVKAQAETATVETHETAAKPRARRGKPK